jgi:hypothetical protein
VYISHDVVFDENIFPFASLHPNVGALLKKEILLLPSSTSDSHESVHNCNDHIMPIVSVTNVQEEDAATEENSSEVDQENDIEHEAKTQSQNDKNYTKNDVDSSEHSSQSTNPEVQRSEDDSPASSVSPSARVDHMLTGPAHMRALLHRHLELVHPRRPHRALTPWRRRYL